MGKKSKKRLVESAELGVNARREGVKSPAQRAPNEGPPVEGYAADNALKARNLAKWAPNLGRPSDFTGAIVPQPSDGLPVDANLQRQVDLAEADHRRSLAEPPMANSPAATVGQLDSAILELNKAIAKVGAGRDADKYARLERLQKAKVACEDARAQILSKVGHDSAGSDAQFRAKASANSSVPGITRAVDQIAALQRRQR
jgi:hypothetical protein